MFNFLQLIGMRGAIAIIFAGVAGLATIMYNLEHSTVEKLRGQVKTLTLQLENAKEQIQVCEDSRNVENEGAIQSYQQLEQSCQSRVKEAVRISRLNHVYPKTTNQGVVTIDANCPSISLSDVIKPQAPNNNQ
jgi:hypothetical protein